VPILDTQRKVDRANELGEKRALGQELSITDLVEFLHLQWQAYNSAMRTHHAGTELERFAKEEGARLDQLEGEHSIAELKEFIQLLEKGRRILENEPTPKLDDSDNVEHSMGRDSSQPSWDRFVLGEVPSWDLEAPVTPAAPDPSEGLARNRKSANRDSQPRTGGSFRPSVITPILTP
jgi:hypothetical protein